MILAVHLKEHVRVPEVEKQSIQSSPMMEAQSELTEVPQNESLTEKEDAREVEKDDTREEEKDDDDGEIEGALSESSDDDESEDDMRIRDIL